MTIRLAPIALLLAVPAAAAPAAAAPAAAQDTAPQPAPLTLQQTSALRCSAAFALAAAAQARGEATGWPPLAGRGREFLVRSSAQIMDDTGWSRDLVALKLKEQAVSLAEPGALTAVMPPCLLMLDASGL